MRISFFIRDRMLGAPGLREKTRAGCSPDGAAAVPPFGAGDGILHSFCFPSCTGAVFMIK